MMTVTVTSFEGFTKQRFCKNVWGGGGGGGGGGGEVQEYRTHFCCKFSNSSVSEH